MCLHSVMWPHRSRTHTLSCNKTTTFSINALNNNIQALFTMQHVNINKETNKVATLTLLKFISVNQWVMPGNSLSLWRVGGAGVSGPTEMIRPLQLVRTQYNNPPQPHPSTPFFPLRHTDTQTVGQGWDRTVCAPKHCCEDGLHGCSWKTTTQEFILRAVTTPPADYNSMIWLRKLLNVAPK